MAAKQFVAFPSIEKYSDVQHHLESHPANSKGTCKIHGTHADVVFDCVNGTMWAQSRNRVITCDKDNCGFAAFVHSVEQLNETSLSLSPEVRDLRASHLSSQAD
jgi:hypothetical protein